MTLPRLRVAAALVVGLLCVACRPAIAAEALSDIVVYERVPQGGIQPQVAVGADGCVHLVYFSGQPGAGDLFYCRRARGETAFGLPIRVNSVSASAIATGTIRGAQLALGANDRPHIAWNGSAQAQPRGPGGETPLLYTRLAEMGDRFEPERNLIQAAYGLDGGACLAADREGHVSVSWHAGTGTGEANRRVWLTHSSDDGQTFDAERTIDVDPVGACGCCGMRGIAGLKGEVYFLYRSARTPSERDIYLLSSADEGQSFTSRRMQGWKIDTCPMSSEALAQNGTLTWAAWETDGQVYISRIASEVSDTRPPTAMPGRGHHRKHPTFAAGPEGTMLLVVTEGTGWNRGGSLAWQLLDREGRPALAAGREEGIPKWSFAAAFPLPDGRFVVLY